MQDDDDQDTLKDIFGEPIYSYTDRQAVEDGALVPLLTPEGIDTLHRVTATAFGELRRYHGREQESKDATAIYVLRELLPLVEVAYRTDRQHREFLKTDYRFRVSRNGGLWYVPNEVGGITILRPEDY
jgi:hypothetical protein